MQVLFEDDHYVALDKSRGMPVHPTVDTARPNLMDTARAALGERWGDPDPYLALHHRLDVWTSGVVVMARAKAANPVLATVFGEHRATKTYVGVCVGGPSGEAGDLRHYLRKRRVDGRDRMVAVRSGGKVARSSYRVLRRDPQRNRSLVEFDLQTGRMHQLRVQSAEEGWPLLGDDLYGDDEVNRATDMHGQLLHARHVSFDDSLSGQRIEVDSAVPPMLTAFVRES